MAGQLVDQSRVDQRHLPLCGEVVTREVPASGGEVVRSRRAATLST